MDCKITGCESCPMYDNGHYGEYELICRHPEAPTQFYDPFNPEKEVFRIEMEESGDGPTYVERVITPDWCPLKRQPITISITNG